MKLCLCWDITQVIEPGFEHVIVSVVLLGNAAQIQHRTHYAIAQLILNTYQYDLSTATT
ncbi:MAG: hypothetical protein KME16_10040 [Scytolyngbya sp. HA4215-MV1]|nr:hypothetical protein [Scytolyngbya sp. HA4215-MV1]